MRFNVPIHVAAEDEEVELELAASGALALQFLDGDVPIARTTFRLADQDGVEPDGSCQLVGLGALGSPASSNVPSLHLRVMRFAPAARRGLIVACPPTSGSTPAARARGWS